MYRLRSYQKLIHELDSTVNPVGVEAFMRVEHNTLDHLPRSAFVVETRMAKLLESEYPGSLRMMADAEGDLTDYDAAEALVE